MSVLIVLYDGFAEYEYQVPALALHHFRIPFEAVGLGKRDVTGMIGLRATTGLGSRVFHVTALLIAALAGEEPAASYRAWAGIA